MWERHACHDYQCVSAHWRVRTYANIPKLRFCSLVVNLTWLSICRYKMVEGSIPVLCNWFYLWIVTQSSCSGCPVSLVVQSLGRFWEIWVKITNLIDPELPSHSDKYMTPRVWKFQTESIIPDEFWLEYVGECNVLIHQIILCFHFFSSSPVLPPVTSASFSQDCLPPNLSILSPQSHILLPCHQHLNQSMQSHYLKTGNDWQFHPNHILHLNLEMHVPVCDSEFLQSPAHWMLKVILAKWAILVKHVLQLLSCTFS